MSNEQANIVVTPEFQMLFPNLFEPRRVKINGKETGDPKYGLSMLFDPDAIGELKEAAKAVALAKWPGRSLAELKFPFADGDKLAAKQEANKRDGKFYAGKIVVKASSKYKPVTVDTHRKEIIDNSRLYSGAWGFAELNFVAYPGVGQNPDGVTAYVNFVMKSRDGDRIAGRDAKGVFAGIQGGETEPSAADVGGTSLDDEIPF